MSTPRIRITAEDLDDTTAPADQEAVELSESILVRSRSIITIDDLSIQTPDDVIVQQSPTRARQKSPRPLRSTLVAGGFIAGLLLITGGIWWAQPHGSWLEQLDRAADQSIVRIETEAGNLGTGFVIASLGDRHLLLTNQHVLAGKDGQVPATCRVGLRSGLAITGTVAATAHHDIDLALVEIRAEGLKPLGPLADFALARVGEQVAAVGHPYGLHFTLTEGILSSKRAGLFLQTTAAINPGNSGGPLINSRRKILGVNTLTFGPAQGIGLAIRADLAWQAQSWLFRQNVSDLLQVIPH